MIESSPVVTVPSLFPMIHPVTDAVSEACLGLARAGKFRIVCGRDGLHAGPCIGVATMWGGCCGYPVMAAGIMIGQPAEGHARPLGPGQGLSRHQCNDQVLVQILCRALQEAACCLKGSIGSCCSWYGCS